MAKLVNDRLKEKIVGNMPKELSNLEKAMFIYDRMCHTLEYALDYYADSEKAGEYYSDPANIAKVDGENEKRVVCYTFKEIFFEICHDEEVITDEFYEEIRLKKERFNPIAHDTRAVLIDDEGWAFDAAEGILDRCDLTMAKYSNHKYTSWEPYYETEEEAAEMNERLNAAMNKVCLNANAERAAEEYYSIKLEQKSFLELPLEKRIDMFLQMVTAPSAPSHSILGLNYILQLKRSLFTNSELNGERKKVSDSATYKVDRYVGLLFVYDTKAEQFKTILAYNPLGYNEARGFENFDSLLLFEIDQATKKVSEIGLEELKEKFDNGQYVERNTTSKSNISSDNSSLLMRKGGICKTEIYEGGKAIYNSLQKPTNIREVVVTYLDGKTASLSPEQYEAGAY